MTTGIFNYTPERLIAAKENLQALLPIVMDNSQVIEVEKLVDFISKAAPDELRTFASFLNMRKLYALAQYLPGVTESDLAEKILTVICVNFKLTILEMLWREFCQACSNANLRKVLEQLLTEVDPAKLLPPYDSIRTFFSHIDPLVPLFQFLQQSTSFQNGLSALRIKPGDTIAQILFDKYFSVAEAAEFRRENADFLREMYSLLSKNPSSKLDVLVNNYLTQVEMGELDGILMNLFNELFDNLSRPNHSTRIILSPQAVEKVKLWPKYKKFKSFFSKANFVHAQAKCQYWLRHLTKVESIEYIQRKSVLILVFKKFVLVDLDDKVSYIYERQAFNNELKMYIHDYTKDISIWKNDHLASTQLVYNLGFESLADRIIAPLL